MTVVSLITQVFSLPYVGELIGFASMSIEALLGFPQLISNWKTKSVKGLSYTMIGMWFLGDTFKTAYFIMEVTHE
jgi:solute carrier family 66, member 2